LIFIIYIYPVPCLRRQSIIYVISLGCYEYVLLCVVVSLVRRVVVSLVRHTVGNVGCRVMSLVELFVRVPCLFEDRAFEPVGGSYLDWLFRSWVRLAMAVTPSMVPSLAFG
jgi:hypothetical protein